MTKRNKHHARNEDTAFEGSSSDTDVRIIGGRFRGRRLQYHGDPIVRPMKHRVREAIFNLISADVTGRKVFDLFAGTGALGLEALSRGATSATLIEKHVPTARIVQENVRTLAVEEQVNLLMTSAFLWAKRDLKDESQESSVDDQQERPPLASQRSTLNAPWLVFCCPPYDFFVERREEMLDLIARVRRCAPANSVLVVEADERFDFAILMQQPAAAQDARDSPDDAANWRVRAYPPAVIGIWAKR